jgi:hypothetical protein
MFSRSVRLEVAFAGFVHSDVKLIGPTLADRNFASLLTKSIKIPSESVSEALVGNSQV